MGRHGDAGAPAMHGVRARCWRASRRTHVAMSNLATCIKQAGRWLNVQARAAPGAAPSPTRPSPISTSAWRRCSRRRFQVGACEMFAKEVIARRIHEFHFWLGVANYKLASRHRTQGAALSMENSSTRGEAATVRGQAAWRSHAGNRSSSRLRRVTPLSALLALGEHLRRALADLVLSTRLRCGWDAPLVPGTGL